MVLFLRMCAVSRVVEAALVIVSAAASNVALAEFADSRLFSKSGLEYLRRG